MDCPKCGNDLGKIYVTHDYTIEYSKEQMKWVKSIGEVYYSDSNCAEEINIKDIGDILKQVDEL